MTNHGRQARDAHVAALEAYLNSLHQEDRGLPLHGGKVNVTAVARACGFNREVLYQNPRCRELLAAMAPVVVNEATASAPESEQARAALERRIMTLERQNAALYAEVQELRRRLKRYEAIEAILVESGHRVIP